MLACEVEYVDMYPMELALCLERKEWQYVICEKPKKHKSATVHELVPFTEGAQRVWYVYPAADSFPQLYMVSVIVHHPSCGDAPLAESSPFPCRP